MMRALLTASAVALLLPAAHGVAQDADENVDRESAAWRMAYDMQGGIFTGVQQSQLLNLAWHGAVANLCEELHLDHLSFGQAMAAIEHSDASSLSDEEHEFFRQSLMINYGVAVGIMLAEHADDQAQTCADAIEFANDPEVTHYFDPEDLGG